MKTNISETSSDLFIEAALEFVSSFYTIFNGDFSYTKNIIPEFLHQELNSFVDRSVGFENWHNRELLVKSYDKLITLIKNNPEFLKRIDIENQYHNNFLQHLEDI